MNITSVITTHLNKSNIKDLVYVHILKRDGENVNVKFNGKMHKAILNTNVPTHFIAHVYKEKDKLVLIPLVKDINLTNTLFSENSLLLIKKFFLNHKIPFTEKNIFLALQFSLNNLPFSKENFLFWSQLLDKTDQETILQLFKLQKNLILDKKEISFFISMKDTSSWKDLSAIAFDFSKNFSNLIKNYSDKKKKNFLLFQKNKLNTYTFFIGNETIEKAIIQITKNNKEYKIILSIPKKNLLNIQKNADPLFKSMEQKYNKKFTYKLSVLLSPLSFLLKDKENKENINKIDIKV